jgi:uncharacterized cupredoxin-like copper-binding protein
MNEISGATVWSRAKREFGMRAVSCFLPLLLVATSGAVSADESQRRVDISLQNFRFDPAAIQLQANVPVTLHLTNNGGEGHDFTAKEFFKAASMDSATRARLGKKGRLDLQPGETRDILLTPRAGSYKVKCGHFLHAGFGMTGTITVK